MLFTKLRLDYFGKFSGKEIELQPGINLIYGENEAGKSTVHTFIKGMLFGIERLRGKRGGIKRGHLHPLPAMGISRCLWRADGHRDRG